MTDRPGVEPGPGSKPGRTRPPNSRPPPDADIPAPVDWVPYSPLGVRGDYMFVLDAGGVLLAMRRKDLNRPTLISVFGTGASSIFQLYPKWRWNDTKREWEQKKGIADLDRAIEELVRRCRAAGSFDPEIQLRGRGAWTDGKGRLVLHFGDHLIVGGKRRPLTVLDGCGYLLRGPTLPALPRMPVSGSEAPGAWLTEQFSRARWQHQRLAPLLLTGAVAAAVLSGALPTRPLLAISGSASWGQRGVLRMIRSALGPFAVIAHEADETRISEAVDCDSLPVVIDPPHGRAAASSSRPLRAPFWMVETAAVRRRRHDGMRFCTEEAANQLELYDHPNFLALALSGRPYAELDVSENDWERRLPLLLRRMIEQFGRLTETVFPAWCELLAVQEGGKTESVRTIAMLLAGAWVLRGDNTPEECDFVALQPELDRLMGAEYEGRRPHWLEVLDGVRSVPVPVTAYRQTTLLEKIGIAAGKIVVGEQPPLDQEERWSEARAIAHARSDPEAREAQRLIGGYGVKVLGDLPERLQTDEDPGGYRCIAIAISAPQRDAQLERMSGWQHLAGQGMSIRTLLQGPKVRDFREATVYFPGLGPKHCLVAPLELVLGGLGGDDPEGTTDAWRKKGEEA